MAIEKYRFVMRQGTAAEATAANDVLHDGEWGYETDTGKLKIGDGVTAWNALPYFQAGGSPKWGGITGRLSDQTDLQNALASIGAFDPAALYAGQTKGCWFDFTNITKMWKDTAGTLPVTTIGDAVARIDDQSGLGFHAVQATSGKRATLGRDSDGTYFLNFTSGNYYACSSAMNAPSFSIVAVFNQANDNGRLFDARGTGMTGTVNGFVLKGFNSASDHYFIIDDGSGHFIQAAVNQFFLNFKQIVSLRYASGVVYATFNGANDVIAPSTSLLSVTPTINNTVGIAANDLTSQSFVGKMYYILGVGRCVTLGQMNGLLSYISNQTGF